MSPTASNEEIIEKKPSAPVATACLIIAAIALLGAILLQLIELGEYRTGIAAGDKSPAVTKVKASLKKMGDEVAGILERTAGAAAGEGEAAPAEPKAGGAEAAEPATDAGDDAAAEPKAEEGAKDAGGEEAAEAAPAEAADEKAEEK
jgi:hypothetical protein